jgi:hypothetical protein
LIRDSANGSLMRRFFGCAGSVIAASIVSDSSGIAGHRR